MSETDPILGPMGRRSLLGAGASLLATPVLAQQALPGTAPAPQAGGAPDNQSAAITVDRARTDPIPIAIPGFGTDTLGLLITSIVTNNLTRSGLFKVITGGPVDTGELPNFAAWKATGAQALVTGNTNGGRVEFRLWDVLPGTQIQGTAYTPNPQNTRRIGHVISDAIYERLLGEKGYFDTRIVYVSGTGPRDRRVKRLAIMDQDSENNRYLSDGSWLVLTPRFHPTRDEIVFMSYANNRPRVYLFNLGSGSQRVLGEYQGITFAPRFAPDGNSVIMSVTRGAGSDIVTIGLGGGGGRQLTNSGAIDTSPCYSPDGSQIVFNSDRGGDQQLYIMGAGGGDAKRISFGSGRYATPVWSPRGDLIAFTRLGGGSFAIGVMHPDGSGERILSESFDVEGPTFCPNGRVIMFFRESPARDSRGNGYSARLVSIDITGFNERVVSTPTDATDPAWSPLLA
jgi:TolB protein